ncbi:CTP synthase 1-like [Penaeus indicus]|uniref:CTP synthase 1-like n=1 Tax=Penaeus indicus TaxID=29960 RepID=UPI00300CCA83
MEGKVSVCKWAKTKEKPLLGICLGLQAAVIEYSRNVLGWTDANSQEMFPEECDCGDARAQPRPAWGHHETGLKADCVQIT